MEDPAEKFGVTLTQIHLVSSRLISRLLREAGIKEISPEQARILDVLWRAGVSGIPQIPIGILVRVTQLSKPTMTLMLNRLEKNGYVTRFPSKTDKRVVLVKRTGKDKSLEKIYADIADLMSETAYQGFTPDEIKQFRNSMRRILNNLTQYYAKHAP